MYDASLPAAGREARAALLAFCHQFAFHVSSQHGLDEIG